MCSILGSKSLIAKLISNNHKLTFNTKQLTIWVLVSLEQTQIICSTVNNQRDVVYCCMKHHVSVKCPFLIILTTKTTEKKTFRTKRLPTTQQSTYIWFCSGKYYETLSIFCSWKRKLVIITPENILKKHIWVLNLRRPCPT